MMELMVEVVIIAFTLGGIIGAIVALHLSAKSAKLKTTKESRGSAPATIELARTEESAELKPVPVDIDSRRTTRGNQRRH